MHEARKLQCERVRAIVALGRHEDHLGDGALQVCVGGVVPEGVVCREDTVVGFAVDTGSIDQQVPDADRAQPSGRDAFDVRRVLAAPDAGALGVVVGQGAQYERFGSGTAQTRL